MVQVHAADSKRQNIVFWHSMTGQNQQAIERIVNDFNASQTKYKVTPEFQGQYVEALQSFYRWVHLFGNIKKDAKFNVGVTYLPRPEGTKANGVVIGGASIWMSKGKSTKVQKGAFEFLKFATSAKEQAQWSIDTGYFAVNTKSYDTKQLKDAFKETPILAAPVNQLKATKLMQQERVNTQNAMENVINGKDVDSELSKAEKQTTSDIKQANEQAGLEGVQDGDVIQRVWTVNEDGELAKLIDLGVAGVFTDDFVHAMQIRSCRGDHLNMLSQLFEDDDKLLSSVVNDSDLAKFKSEDDIMNQFKLVDPTHEAENASEFWKRVDQGFNYVYSKAHDGDKILIITHGALIRKLATRVTGTYHQNPDNASLSIFEMDETKCMKLVSYDQLVSRKSSL
ncbi:hypothetical protein Pfo_031444 [Paulownia fortunei]|nr:hypothetical protein Pfo_031444 [Paulownia fortunei]